MAKFKIEYYYVQERTEEVEARHYDEALKKFREEHGFAGVKSVKYVYEGKEKPKEWYCIWWNGNTWKSKIVLAHNEDEIRYNIRDTLDYAVYNFDCCLNTPEKIEGLHRCIWD